jgi:hypothetical protein
MGVLTDLAPKTEAEQYLRTCKLIVFGSDLDGLDLSELRIKFSVKRSDTMTPNVADIRVYNLEEETAKRIRKEFTKVILQAGYEGNFGVIFQGNIKQVILGRESATDTFIDIVAGDGDRAYNFAIVNTTIAAGGDQLDQVNAAIGAMAPKGVTAGTIGEMPPEKLPRGKVMYGNARNYLRDVAQSSDKSWSIQDEKVTFIDKKAYLPNERVVLTSKTGMIGTPQQTNEGVNVKCLLNPLIRIGTKIEIDNASIARYKINLSVPNSPANIPAPLSADGVYYVLVVEHSGDTRGIDWYSTLICLNIDVTTNPINSVQVGYG